MKQKNAAIRYEKYAEQIISKLAQTEKLEKKAIASNLKNLLIETEENTRAYAIERLDRALLLFNENMDYYQMKETLYDLRFRMSPPPLIVLITSDLINVAINNPPSELVLKPMLLRDDAAILSDFIQGQDIAWWLVSTDEGYKKYKTIINKAIKEIKKNPKLTSFAPNQKKEDKIGKGVKF